MRGKGHTPIFLWKLQLFWRPGWGSIKQMTIHLSQWNAQVKSSSVRNSAIDRGRWYRKWNIASSLGSPDLRTRWFKSFCLSRWHGLHRSVPSGEAELGRKLKTELRSLCGLEHLWAQVIGQGLEKESRRYWNAKPGIHKPSYPEKPLPKSHRILLLMKPS